MDQTRKKNSLCLSLDNKLMIECKQSFLYYINAIKKYTNVFLCIRNLKNT